MMVMNNKKKRINPIIQILVIGLVVVFFGITIMVLLFLKSYKNSYVKITDIDRKDNHIFEEVLGFSFTENAYAYQTLYIYGKDIVHYLWVYNIDDKQVFLDEAKEYKLYDDNSYYALDVNEEYVDNSERYIKNNIDETNNYELYMYKEDGKWIAEFYFVGYSENHEFEQIFLNDT